MVSQMECAQINVTGGSGSASPATYSIPGIYKANDPGLLINIYSMTPSSTYTIPGTSSPSRSSSARRLTDAPYLGPKLFSCDGSPSGGGSSDGGSTPTTTSKPATTLTTSTTAKTTTTAAPGGCTVAAYAQCGGIGYTGCTTCASGSSCKKSNDYYSQCL